VSWPAGLIQYPVLLKQQIMNVKTEEIINYVKLSQLVAGSDNSLRKNKVPKKYQAAVKELNDLLEYWRKRNGF
jgi:hypothetical protein